jgi:hypothetical protein
LETSPLERDFILEINSPDFLLKPKAVLELFNPLLLFILPLPVLSTLLLLLLLHLLLLPSKINKSSPFQQRYL